MDIQEAKKIAIADYLEKYGFVPIRIQGNDLWYCSPFRKERTPSFKVNQLFNCWYDHGIGVGGNIIDLVMLLHSIGNVSDVLRHLTLTTAGIHPASVSFQQQGDLSSILVSKIKKLEHPALVDYLVERKINVDIAQECCDEVHYRIRKQFYFAIGFRNDVGGYELRNKFFKGAISPKDVTIVNNASNTCCIFEGFMDYLSYLTLQQSGGLLYPVGDSRDYIVLNSVANFSKIVGRLKDYRMKYCFLDNDDAGSKTLKDIQARCGLNVFDQSVCYRGYKDLNDYLINARDQIQKMNNLSISEEGKVIKYVDKWRSDRKRKM